MADIRRLSGSPRIFVFNTMEFIDLTYKIDVEPDENSPVLQMMRSLEGYVQMSSQKTFDRLRILCDELPRAEAFALMRIYTEHLTRGLTIAFIRDRTKYFHASLTDNQAIDHQFGLRPLTSSKFTFSNWHNYRNRQLGAVGVFDNDPEYFTRTNMIVDGSFLDTAFGAQPAGWVLSDTTHISAVVDSWLCPTGKNCVKISEKTTGATYPVVFYHTFDIGVDLIDVERFGVSWAQRCDRGASLTPILLEVRIYRHLTNEWELLYSGTPSVFWEPKGMIITNPWVGGGYTQARIEFRVQSRLATSTLYITDVQFEPAAQISGFLSYSPTRGATGSRQGEGLRYRNFLDPFFRIPNVSDLILPTPSPTPIRGAFTVATYILQGWHTFNMPNNGNCPVMSFSDLELTSSGGKFFWINFADYNDLIVQVPIEQSPYFVQFYCFFAWPTQAELSGGHIMFSWLDYDSVTGSDGEYRLYVNGGMILGGTHEYTMARFGQVMKVGENSGGTVRANAWFHDFRVDPVYVDDDYVGTYTGAVPVSEYHESGEYADLANRERLSWRLVMDPRQRGNIVTLEDNAYKLDGRFEEVPWQ